MEMLVFRGLLHLIPLSLYDNARFVSPLHNLVLLSFDGNAGFLWVRAGLFLHYTI